MEETVNCGYCFTPVHEANGPRCGLCEARIHSECWTDNQGCTTFGCNNNPVAKGAS